MAHPYSREELGAKAEQEGFDSTAAMITFDLLRDNKEIVPVGGGQYLDKDIVLLKSNPSGLTYKTLVKGPIAMETSRGPVVLSRNPYRSYTYEPVRGDHVVNTNPQCQHYQSRGIVLSVQPLSHHRGSTITYRCVNDGPTWDEGDVLTKTMDQVDPLS